MTEYHWLTADDPRELLHRWISSPHQPSGRKLRLLGCAAVRLTYDHLQGPMMRQAVALAERVADGQPITRKMERIRSRLLNLAEEPQVADETAPVRWPPYEAAFCLDNNPRAAAMVALADQSPQVRSRVAEASAVRCLAGNPFRPPPSWRPDATVVAIAQAAYDHPAPCPCEVRPCGRCHGDGTCGELDRHRLAVLSDALEEAGYPTEAEVACKSCLPYAIDAGNVLGAGYRPERSPASGRHEGGWTNCKTCNGGPGRLTPGTVRGPSPLLAHLRGQGPHFKGCWAVDFLLARR